MKPDQIKSFLHGEGFEQAYLASGYEGPLVWVVEPEVMERYPHGDISFVLMDHTSPIEQRHNSGRLFFQSGLTQYVKMEGSRLTVPKTSYQMEGKLRLAQDADLLVGPVDQFRTKYGLLSSFNDPT